MENNAENYTKIKSTNRDLSRKKTSLKYTKVDSLNKKLKGWDRKGIIRLNILGNAIKINRGYHESKEREIELRLN